MDYFMTNNIISVLTSDIVNSSKMKTEDVENLVGKQIPALISKMSSIAYNYSSYRGDSTQVTILDPTKAIYVATLLRIYVIACTNYDERYTNKYDIRTSIGIGTRETDNNG